MNYVANQYRGVYVVRHTLLTVTGIRTLVQIKAGPTTGLELLRAHIGFRIHENDQSVASIVRKTVAATVLAVTPVEYNEDGPAADAVSGTAATGQRASAEGTNGDVLYEATFNMRNGFHWTPTPAERITVQPGDIVTLIHNRSIQAASALAVMVFGEF